MSRRPSTETNKFNATATAVIPRSSFDLSHGLKTTFDANELIPIFNMEILPGDSISLRASIFGRMATPLKPLLDNLHCETFFFFTPTRQVWDNWIKFHGEQETPTDSIDFLVPVLDIQAGDMLVGSTADYLGLPTENDVADVTLLPPISSLPFRCLNHIYNNWFRDQNISTARQVPKGDGPDLMGANNFTTPAIRRKRKDYFTGCLPWPQKHGDVTVSLGEFAPVTGLGIINPPLAIPGVAITETDGSIKTYANQYPSSTLSIEVEPVAGITPNIFADLSQAAGISINDLRESIQIQRLLERDARSGSRYPELLRSHFGVSDPMMLVHQRPVFLGGGHTMINVTPIAQTAAGVVSGTGPGGGEIAETPQGNLAGVGTISASGHGFTYSATEHGFITGLINVRADLTYQKGIERYWSRQTRFDYFYPALGHLGEMAVLNKELFQSADPLIDDAVFGYQEAWADYRYIPSKITGLFRSSDPASLDVWHLAQDFLTLPALNSIFIRENVPMDRVLALPSEPDFLLDVYFKIRAARPLPLYGTPGLMDHF